MEWKQHFRPYQCEGYYAPRWGTGDLLFLLFLRGKLWLVCHTVTCQESCLGDLDELVEVDELIVVSGLVVVLMKPGKEKEGRYFLAGEGVVV